MNKEFDEVPTIPAHQEKEALRARVDELEEGVKEIADELKNTLGSVNVNLLVDDLEKLLSQSTKTDTTEGS